MTTSFDGNNNTNYNVPVSYLLYPNNSFWLQTSRNINGTSYVSAVNSTTGQITINNTPTISDTYGIRPVILINKVNIK